MMYIPYFENLFTDFDFFIIVSLIISMNLLRFYNGDFKIKKERKKEVFENPIYQPKDILLQSKNTVINDFPIEKGTSIYAKILMSLLIGIVVFTPIYKLLSTDYFL